MLDLLIIALVVVIFTLWLQSKPFFWKVKGIAWKLPLPILGNTGMLFIQPWHQFWRDFYKNSGDSSITGFHFFFSPALMIKDPELLKKIMISDAQHFSEREFIQDKIDPVGRSLFFTKGQEWKNQRTKMTPYFTPARIKAMMPYLHPLTDTFVEAISQQSKQGLIDTRTVSLKLATDVIMSNVFGLKPDAFENPNSFFYHLQKELLGFDTGIRAVIGVLSPTLYEFFGLTFFRRSTIKKLSNFVTDVITQRSKGVGVRPDFMQGMVELLAETEKEAKQNGAFKHDKADSVAKFDKKTVIGQCMLMYSAGTETTGNTLSFLLYELALNQPIQGRLRQEINAMLQQTNGEYGVEELHKLQYMNQVISECLRKYPVASVIGRKCSKKYNLDGLDIPVGTVISVPIVAFHRDPRFYPDPENFDPDRFSSSSNIVAGTYLPFGLGPRTCIGMKLALTELCLSLVKLLPKFKLVQCPETPATVSFSSAPSLSSGIPLWVKAQPIQ